ncbi:hypothetical protein [Streptomyces europaeiscabiei]|uniref:hypothetical protein n=1 Tax=Streptomyces europaeiscabiei TaxID=146819 RepID=UPI002E0E3524|nr:hypothetical protein OHB30_01310 [Streptomyces europaeiscabiei]
MTGVHGLHHLRPGGPLGPGPDPGPDPGFSPGFGERTEDALGPRPSPESRRVACRVEGNVGDTPFAVTTSHGLLLWNGRHFRRVTRGPARGLTVRDGALWVFQRAGRHGRVLSVHLAGDDVEVVPRIWGLPGNGHCIDFVDDELMVTDPSHNQVLAYRVGDDGPAVHAAHAARAFCLEDRTPRVPLRISALFRHGPLLFVMASKGRGHDSRQSEIWAFDSQSRLVTVVPAGGTHCHDLFFDGEQFVLCRSRERTVVRGPHPVYRADGFPRGLAVGEDRVLVGVSAYARSRYARETGAASVEFLDRDFRWQGRITLPRGQIRNVRLLSDDLATSNAEPRSAPRRTGRPANRGLPGGEDAGAGAVRVIPAPPSGRGASANPSRSADGRSRS